MLFLCFGVEKENQPNICICVQCLLKSNSSNSTVDVCDVHPSLRLMQLALFCIKTKWPKKCRSDGNFNLILVKLTCSINDMTLSK